QAGDLRFFLEQASDVRSWYVALYEIAVHDCRVTRAQSVGDPKRAFDFRHGRRVLGVDTIPVLDQVLDPALAAAAARILVDGDGRGLWRDVEGRHRSGARGEYQRRDGNREREGSDES